MKNLKKEFSEKDMVITKKRKKSIDRSYEKGFWGEKEDIEHSNKHGYYYVYYYVDQNPRKQIKRKTYEKVVEQLEKKREEYYRNDFVIDKNKTTLGQVAQRWLTTHQTVGKKLTTESHLNLEILCIGLADNPNLLEMKVQNIKFVHIESFLKVKSTKVSESTMKKYKQILSNLFKYALNLEIIGFNPMERWDFSKIRSIKNTKIKNAMTPSDRKLFLEYIEKVQYKNLFLLLYRTGLRIGEALAIQESDLKDDILEINHQLVYKRKFDIEDKKDEKFIKYLDVNAKDNKVCGKLKLPKGANSIRKIPVSKNTIDLIKNEIQIRNDEMNKALATGKNWVDNNNTKLIFVSKSGRHLTPRNVSRALKTICVNSGMSREYSLHELRHTAITRLCEEGISTQDLVPLVGHSDPVMINTIYNSFQNEASLEKKESIKKFF